MIINKRPAKIGASINSRTEKHGEEDVPAFDIPLEEIMLPKAELNAFMKDKTQWDRWFNERKDGLPEPANTNLKAFAHTDKFDKSSGTIFIAFGSAPIAFEFEVCSIAKIRLLPCVGGLTEMSCTLQALINDSNTALFEHLSRQCEVELDLGMEKKKKNAKQAELALVATNGAEASPP